MPSQRVPITGVTMDEAAPAGSGDSRQVSVLSGSLISCVYCPMAGQGGQRQKGKGLGPVRELLKAHIGERGRRVFTGKLSSAQVKGDLEDFIPQSGVRVEDRRG